MYFLGAAGVTHRGPVQSNTLLIQAERRFLKRTDQVVLMFDSTKFHAGMGHILCPLEERRRPAFGSEIGRG